MQPKLVDLPPTGDGWLHDIKYDGNRVQIHVDGKTVTTFTRNGHDWTAKFQPLAIAARGLLARRGVGMNQE